MARTDLSRKALRAFGDDKVVDKSLIWRYGHITKRIPLFISEFIVGKCVEKPLGRVEECFSKYRRLLPSPDEKDKILFKLSEEGEYTIIDEFRASVKFGKEGPLVRLRIPSLGIDDALVDESILERYSELLGVGVWGMGRLAYTPLLGSKRGGATPIMLVDLIPFQVTGVELRDFKEARGAFDLGEWIDLLVISLGLKPEFLGSIERKLLYLSRLLPLVEENLHLIELGPRGTGKSFIYKNLSHYVWLVSGGTISTATLFYNLRLRTPGQVALRDAVVFDEVAKLRFGSPEVASKLKDFMETGSFERGAWRGHSGCSLVFLGNTDSRELNWRVLRDLPRFMDAAMMDRVCGFIEGWRIPKLASSSLSLADGYGLYTFYLAEVLHLMRREAFTEVMDRVEVLNATIRDERSVKKLASSLVKLLFPHGEYDKGELELVVKAAVELRQRIRLLLHYLIPQEYARTELGVKLS